MSLHPQLDTLINAMLPFVQKFHGQGQLAPHAASMDNSGEIKGSALINQGGKEFSISEALAHFESTFRNAASANEIVASAVFFHGVGLSNPSIPAQTIGEACSLVAMLEHKDGDSVFLVIPYEITEGTPRYEIGKLIAKPAAVFTASPKVAKPWWRIW